MINLSCERTVLSLRARMLHTSSNITTAVDVWDGAIEEPDANVALGTNFAGKLTESSRSISGICFEVSRFT